MTKLQTLRLANTKLTDAGLEYLKALKQLRELSLYSTDVTEASVVELRKTPRKLEWYDGQRR